ncbi:MAG: TolC family protein [Methylococcaceae bacterium]|nr:TolC family protein [Methylococcaceae bacterium]
MNKQKLIRLFSFTLMLATLTLQAEPLPLVPAPAEKNLAITEQQAIALFYQRNLDLIAAHFNIDVAAAQEVIAAAIPNPVFSFNISELSPEIFKSSNNSQPLPGISPALSQLIETAGKRQLRVESSELATEAVTFDLQDTLRTLTNAVRRDYYSLLLAQKNLQMAEDNFKRYHEILRVNGIRLKTGDIAETDYTRMEVESLKAQADQDQAQATLKQARATLLLLLGWPENSMDILAVEAWPKATSTITDAKQEQLVKQALEKRPDLQAARIRIAQAQKMLTLANRLVIPDVTISAYYQRDPGNYFTDSGGVGISLPLPLFYRQEGEISKAHIGVSSAELALTQTEQSIRSDVIKAMAAWKSADAIAQRFETLVVTRIETLRKEQEFAYENGAIGLLDLIDAERSYKAMMLDYYTALANRSNAWADLLMAYGEEVKL